MFHSYAFIKRSKNEAFRHFLFDLTKWLPWKRGPLEKLQLQLWLCISKFYECARFHYHQVAGEKQKKKLSMIKIFKFFISDYLKSKEEGSVTIFCFISYPKVNKIYLNEFHGSQSPIRLLRVSRCLTKSFIF